MKAVNLIPNEQRTSAKPAAAGAAAPSSSGGDGFGAYAILGLLAFAVIAAALYVMAGNKISENQATLDRVQQESQAIQAEAAKLQTFADFKTLADARSQTVRGLADARFDWDTALDDVSRALPGDVFISSFEGTTSSAGGGSSIRGAISAPAIQLIGCTETQSDVARLMARLRNVRGVTRVSLAKSVVTSTDESAATSQPLGATGDGPAAKTVSIPCPKGDPPNFDLVAFFERAPVGTGAAPNTGVAVGTTGPTGPTGTAGATTPASSTTTP